MCDLTLKSPKLLLYRASVGSGESFHELSPLSSILSLAGSCFQQQKTICTLPAQQTGIVNSKLVKKLDI